MKEYNRTCTLCWNYREGGLDCTFMRSSFRSISMRSLTRKEAYPPNALRERASTRFAF